MKALIKATGALVQEGRWDIDYHLPAEAIQRFPQSRQGLVSSLATVSIATRDPSAQPQATFLYVDIASVDVEVGAITNPQELTGEEAPSRARMVIQAFDVIVSTVRPTRGATAVVPPNLHNQICSTGFCVLRPNEGVNPYYLHFALRAPSTLEQFRKFSTGSSYPAILDDDVLKAVIPLANEEEQDFIALQLTAAYQERERLLKSARQQIDEATSACGALLHEPPAARSSLMVPAAGTPGVTTKEIAQLRAALRASALPIFERGENLGAA